MADFKAVLKVAQDGYGKRDDYPPFGLMGWVDRARWTAYLELINAEADNIDGPAIAAARERLKAAQ